MCLVLSFFYLLNFAVVLVLFAVISLFVYLSLLNFFVISQQDQKKTGVRRWPTFANWCHVGTFMGVSCKAGVGKWR